MRIENEMLTRLVSVEKEENVVSNELDFFFNNVMDTVVDYFTEREEILK